eukprot:7604050-Pyramimonas_sp.AAC.1
MATSLEISRARFVPRACWQVAWPGASRSLESALCRAARITIITSIVIVIIITIILISAKILYDPRQNPELYYPPVIIIARAKLHEQALFQIEW